MAQWSKEALENFRKVRKEKNWKAGRQPLTEQQRLERGLHEGNWKQRNPELHAAHRREYTKRYPEKIAAQNAVIYALRVGRTRDGAPFMRGACAICDQKQNTEAHHASYAVDRHYDVTWLCRPCHVKVGKENGQVKRRDFKKREYLK